MKIEKHSRRLPLFFGVFAGVSCVLGQPESTNVTVARAITREVADGKVFVGSVLPARTSIVGSAVDGRVVTLPIEEGDFVAGGETIAQLRTATIEAEVAAARAELALRRHELAELKSGSRPEEIEQVKARMSASRARMDNAKRDLRRVRRAYESRSAADDELDGAESFAAETEQTFLEAKAAHDLVVAGPRAERIAQAEARVAIQVQEVKRLEDLLDKYTIVAPFDGYVTEKNTEVGEWVTRGQAVATIVDLTAVDVEVLVLEDYVSRLSVGDVASVRIASYPGQVFTGTIYRIVPRADARSRSFPVRIRVPNRFSRRVPHLMAGMFAEATLQIGDPVLTTLVPKDAIVLGGQTSVVFVVEQGGDGGGDGGRVREVPVSVGVATDELIAIRGTVEPDALVVVRGNERLRPGQKVTITDRLPLETGRTDLPEPKSSQ